MMELSTANWALVMLLFFILPIAMMRYMVRKTIEIDKPDRRK